MDLHKLLNPQTLERRNNSLQLRLHEYSIESVLIADRFEDIELDQRESVPFTIFELLEEFALRLIVEVGILGVFHILQPNG